MATLWWHGFPARLEAIAIALEALLLKYYNKDF